MKRFLVSLIALVTTIAVLAGCTEYDQRDAATSGNAAVINGTALTNAQFEKELDALVANKLLVAAVKKQGGQPLTGRDKSVRPDLAASWLQQDISWVLLNKMAAELKAKATAKDRKAAAANAAQGYPSKEIWDAFPQWFKEAQIESLATSAAVVRKITEKKPTDADLQTILDAVPAAQLPQVQCISHILLPAADTAKAADLKRQIDKGGDFAALAKSNSTDTVSAAQGGSLGCLRSDNANLDPAFQKGADDAVVGKVTAAVTSQFGIHLILVTDRHPAQLDDLRKEVTQQFESQQARDYVTKYNEKAKVTVGKRWGTVALDQGRFVVKPPATKSSTTTAPAGTPTAPASGSSTSAP